jgi:flagellar motor protein MotB
MFAALVMASLLARSNAPREDPPIVTLSEADGFFFATGSAELGSSFRKQLIGKVTPQVRVLGERYDASIIEVIGHTDEVPLRARRSNLDHSLLDAFAGRTGKVPVAADNYGLAMARAVAVAAILRRELGRDFTVVPLSAGPFLKPDDTVIEAVSAVSVENRRRIEIRLRRPVRSRSPD